MNIQREWLKLLTFFTPDTGRNLFGIQLARLAAAALVGLMVAAPAGFAQSDDRLATVEQRRSAALALARELGALMIASGDATHESVAESIATLESDLPGIDPSVEELQKVQAIARGVIAQAAVDAEDRGDAARADSLLERELEILAAGGDVDTALRVMREVATMIESAPAVRAAAGGPDSVGDDTRTAASAGASIAAGATGSDTASPTTTATRTTTGSAGAGGTGQSDGRPARVAQAGGTSEQTGQQTAAATTGGSMAGWTVDFGGFEATPEEVTAEPASDGYTSYYIAPPELLGGLRVAKAITLDKKSWGGAYYKTGESGAEGDVVIASGDSKAYYDIEVHHSGEWKTFVIPLSGDGWTLREGASSLEAILANVTDLRIRAEYGSGTDYSALRRVALVGDVEPGGGTGAAEAATTAAVQTDITVETGPVGAVTIVFDGSNSMWGQVDGRPKIEIAREALAELVSGWRPDSRLGLMAFGHRRESDCTDIETLRPPGPNDPLKFVLAVGGITPRGKSPITAAVRQAAAELDSTNAPATVVLFSDGVETCDADPCALAAELEQSGIGFTAHVIGFGVEGDDEQLSCLAQATGGLYLEATNERELSRALATVRTAATEPEKSNIVVLEAVSSRTGERIRTGVSWRVISLDSEEAVPLVAGISSPSLPLDAGKYMVEARAGDAVGRSEIVVRQGQASRVEVVIDAGGEVSPAATGTPVVELESNDSFGRATPASVAGFDLSATADGSTFGKAQAVAETGRLVAAAPENVSIWRRIGVPDQGELAMAIVETPAGSVVSLRVWNAEASALSGWLNFTTGREVFDLAAPGDYLLEIRSANAGGTVAFDLAFTATGDALEPNDSFGSRAGIAPGEPFELAILPRGDADWLAIEVPDQGSLTLSVEADSAGEVRLGVRLWNAGVSALTGWIDLTAAAEAHLELAEPGTYVLEIRDRKNEARSPQRLRITPTFAATGDVHEPNPSFGRAAAIDIAGRLEATTFPRGDIDWFRVEAADQGTLTMTLTGAPDGIQPNVRLWNGEASALTGWEKLDGGVAEFDLKSAGTYRLEIRDAGNDGASTEPWGFDLAFAPTGETAEPNDSFGFASPFAPGETISGAILPQRDYDWRLVRVDTRGELSLRATEVPEGLNLAVRLWNADGGALTGWAHFAEGPVVFDLAGGGEYRLEFHDGGDDARSPENYVVETSFTPGLADPETDAGDVLVGTLFPAGDRDWFELAVPRPGPVTIRAVELPPGLEPEVRIWNRERSALTGWLPMLVNGSKASAEVDLTEPGGYVIEIRDRGDDGRSTARYQLAVERP